VFNEHLVNGEIEYVLNKRLRQNLNNESAWAYMRGMLATSAAEAEASLRTNNKKILITEIPVLKKECLSLLEEDVFNKSDRFIYVTLIDYAIAENNQAKAVEYLELLKKIDKIRENYYQWRINKIQSKAE